MNKVSSSNGLKELPTLRFRDSYSNEFPKWEKVTFKDIFSELLDKTSDTLIYPLHSLTIEQGITIKTERYEREYLITKGGDSYKIVPPNAFVYNPMNLRFGALAVNHHSFPVSVSGYYNVFINNNYDTIPFWENYLKTTKMLNHYYSIATGSLIEKLRVHYSQFIEIQKMVPTIEEQVKISSFLTLFDEKIKKQEELVNNLKKYKRGMLNLIFVNLNKYPKEELENLFYINAGGDIDKNNYSKEANNTYKYPIYANSLQNNGLYGYANFYKISGNSITVTGRGEVGHAIARHDFYVPIVRLLTLIPKNNENVDFFANIINNTHIFIESTGVPQLTSPQLSKIKVFNPPNSLQNYYAYILNELDLLIDCNKIKFEKLCDLKKGLLQQLFI